jgi:small-conductance mechanosensitive channel
MQEFELSRPEKSRPGKLRKTAFLRSSGSRRVAVATLLFLGIGLTALLVQSAEQLDRDAVLSHLNAAIKWYQEATSEVQTVGLPNDAIYQHNAQTLAAEAVRLAFESAKAEAKLISAAESQPSGTPEQQEKFSQMLERVSSQIDQAQSRIEALDKQIVAARGAKRDNLISQRQNLQDAIELDKAMEDVIQKMAAFTENNNDISSKGLDGSIRDLARSIPEVLGSPNAQGPAAKPDVQAAQPQPKSASSGLIGEAINVYSEMRSLHDIDKLVAETANLGNQVTELQKPLRANLIATVHRARDLANLPESTDPAQPPQTPPAVTSEQPQVPAAPGKISALTKNFKQLSSALIPLSQETVVLDESRSNFLQWRKSVVSESRSAVRSLVMRVIVLALALGLVFFLSEVWRRLTFRYIRDPRRRHQFLIMRRFVIGFLIGVVFILGFVSEFNSLATFAGFATAGIAVGLQAVILSMAAYFFVVGRYGISVGERISIAGVTGDVVDIGLVRLYLIELAGTGIDLYPTGRIVVFTNSVLFQPATPLYKQIPGAEYSWHEVAVALAPDADYKLVQDKILAAVNSEFAQYRATIERQYGDIERRMEIQLQMPSPEGRLQFADLGLEFIVRYPLEIRKAAEVDDNITKRLLEATKADPSLKAAVLGTPRIRAAVKG